MDRLIDKERERERKRERAKGSTLLKPILWSAKIVVWLSGGRSWVQETSKQFKHVLHHKGLIWEHLDPGIGYVSRFIVKNGFYCHFIMLW